MNLNIICQIATALFGSVSIACFSLGYKKFGCIFTLIGEPFWFYVFFTNAMWGMFVTSIWYTISGIYGLYLIRKEKQCINVNFAQIPKKMTIHQYLFSTTVEIRK